MAALSRLGISASTSAPSFICSRLRVISLRAYGSAAAAIQYDYEDDNDHRRSRLPEPSMELTAMSGWERGVQWVLIGEPGARKHVYAKKLSKLLEVPHISMATLLSQELNPRSSLYKQIANAVNEGKLVPEEVIFGLLSKKLEEDYYKGESGFILDGIPRSKIQAEILDQIADIDLVVNFKCTEENLVKKELLLFRNSSYSVTDAESALKEKFRLCAEQGKAVEDYYRKQKKLVDFQMASAPGETWKGLLATLRLKHLGAINSSHKLTA